MSDKILIVCACTKCMKYVIIFEDYLSINKVNFFKEDHIGHPMINVNISEVDNRYKSCDQEYLKLVKENR